MGLESIISDVRVLLSEHSLVFGDDSDAGVVEGSNFRVAVEGGAVNTYYFTNFLTDDGDNVDLIFSLVPDSVVSFSAGLRINDKLVLTDIPHTCRTGGVNGPVMIPATILNFITSMDYLGSTEVSGYSWQIMPHFMSAVKRAGDNLGVVIQGFDDFVFDSYFSDMARVVGNIHSLLGRNKSFSELINIFSGVRDLLLVGEAGYDVMGDVVSLIDGFSDLLPSDFSVESLSVDYCDFLIDGFRSEVDSNNLILNSSYMFIFSGVLVNLANLSVSDERFSSVVDLLSDVDLVPFLFNSLKDEYSNNGFSGLSNVLSTVFNRLKGVDGFVDSVLSSYELFLVNNDFSSINKLFNLSGVKPVFSDELIHSTYGQLLSNGEFNSVYQLSKLLGVKPSNDVIQVFYEKLLNKDKISIIGDINTWLGYMPSDDLVKSAYDKFLSEGKFSSINRLFKLSGVKPVFSDKKIQSVYEQLLSESKVLAIRDLFNFLGVKPVFSEERVQLVYEELFAEGDVLSGGELFGLSGVKPAAGLVQSAYKSLLNNDRLLLAYHLFDWSKIKPSLKLVQTVYERLLNSGDFKVVNELSEWMGALPSGELLQSVSEGFLIKGDVSSVYQLKSLFNVLPPEELFKQTYERLMSDGYSSKALGLRGFSKDLYGRDLFTPANAFD